MIVIAGQARQKEKGDKDTAAEEEEADFNRLNGLLYKTVFFFLTESVSNTTNTRDPFESVGERMVPAVEEG